MVAGFWRYGFSNLKKLSYGRQRWTRIWIKFGRFSVLWCICIGFGFYKFCLTGFGLELDLLISFWTSPQLSVLFRNSRLLYLICTFASVEFHTSAKIVYCVCIWSIDTAPSDARYKPALSGIMSSKLRNSCDFHWFCTFPWPIIAIVKSFLYVQTNANDSLVLYIVPGNFVCLIQYLTLCNWASHCIWS